MKKKIFYTLPLLSSLFIVPTTTIVLTSCQSNYNNTQVINIDALKIDGQKNNFLLEKTANEWLDIINSNNQEGFLLLEELINIYNKTNLDAPINLTSDSKFISSQLLFDSNNPTMCNIKMIFETNKKRYQLNLNNIFYFANSIFFPPTTYSYTFNQVDLSNISDKSYKEINNAEWTNAFNSKLQTSIIPQFGYTITKKTVDPNNELIYTITYSVDELYAYQISLLPNASNFQDIVITVNLSPYIGKKLQRDFALSQTEINLAFGDNASIDSVYNLPPLTIYQKLAEYVRINLPGIQPIRDCLENNSPVGFQKIKDITSPNVLTVKFESNSSSIIKYKYIFKLTFN